MSKAILIISAGASSRLGEAKQLVKYKNDVLINHIIKECLATEIEDIFLILGANRQLIKAQLIEGDFITLENKKWKEGMGKSIAFGVSEATKINTYEGVFIILSDQVFFDSTIIDDMLTSSDKNPDNIILSKYQEGQGPPSYFPAQYFGPLSKLTGDDGAKEIIQANRDKIIYVNFEKGNIDIDTPEDLQHLL